MSDAAPASFGLIGALDALPRRLAARAVAEAGCGRLHRGMTRRTTLVVFGRGLLARWEDAAIEARVAAAQDGGAVCLSESAFLRAVGIVPQAAGVDLAREAVLAQSGLPAQIFDLLVLFDAFESSGAAFGFRDVILARKYAGLLAGGAGWGAIARSVHRAGNVSLTARVLEVGGERTIYARMGSGVSELDGQLLLGLETDAADADDLFAAAEDAETAGRHAEAARIYGRCLAADPGDAIAAFNRANCLRAVGEGAEAAQEYARALQMDPGLVEAWFNFADLRRTEGRAKVAREYLERAVALDPEYADAVYNLATLAFEEADYGAAREHWQRYLELDACSEWAQTATRGIAYIDRAERARSAG